MIRKAKAVWHGTGRDGAGNLTTDSGVLDATPYSFKTRFENEKGTNPEELIAAAHAGCFTMALAFQLQAAGFTPTELSTEAAVTLEKDGAGIPHQPVRAHVARASAEPRRSRLRTHGRRGREELPGLESPQRHNHAGCEVGLDEVDLAALAGRLRRSCLSPFVFQPKCDSQNPSGLGDFINVHHHAARGVALAFALLLAGCAGRPVVLSGFQDRPSTINLTIVDLRPQLEKTSERLSPWVTSCDYEIHRLGDETSVPSKLVLLRRDLEDALGGQLKNSTVTVTHYRVFSQCAEGHAGTGWRHVYRGRAGHDDRGQ